MTEKKQHGGDLFDKLQAHNRNVALAEQAKAAKEQAKAAKENKEAQDRHFAEMKAIAERDADIKAKQLQLAEDEKNARDFAKMQNNQIHTLSRRTKEIDAAITPGAKYLIICELQANLNAISIDAVTEIEYRDRFFDTKEAIEKAKSNLLTSEGDFGKLLFSYDILTEQAKECSKVNHFHSFAEKDSAQKIIVSIGKVEEKYPELHCPETEYVQKITRSFYEDAKRLYALWAGLKETRADDFSDAEQLFLVAQFDFSKDIFTEKEFCEFSDVNVSQDEWNKIYKIFHAFLADVTTPAAQLQFVLDFITSKTSKDRIDVKAFRLEDKRQKARMEENKAIAVMLPVCQGVHYV